MPVQVDKNKCVGCGFCESSCPRDAIEVHGLSAIDYDKCTECFGGTYSLANLARGGTSIASLKARVMSCIRNCPAKALSYSS